MRFSTLTQELPGTTNRLYERVEALRSEKIRITDLIRADPREAGVVFPSGLLEQALLEAANRAQRYQPDPLGQPAAREALQSYAETPSKHLVLTPGSSVSYSYLFKLLCQTGDQVLCPVPSYPLFDYIARLEGVEIRHYRLDERRGWRMDLEHLEQQITEKTRAIVVISPHNPTGMVLDGDEVEALAIIADRHALPIISDEVFREFVFENAELVRPMASHAPLVFTLNGFSKMFALPGLKLGWIGVSGTEPLVGQSMATLEMISDTFLPVNEIAQFSVPRILEDGQDFLEDYRARIEACRNAALSLLDSQMTNPPAGGFYAVVPYQREIEDEDLAIEIVGQTHTLVHPGYLYDIEGSHIVLSFVHAPGTLETAITRLKALL